MDTGDTAWLLTSTALVLLMTPGLAFFYGGMVRGRNVLAMLMKNYVAMGVRDGDMDRGRLLARVQRRRAGVGADREPRLLRAR